MQLGEGVKSITLNKGLEFVVSRLWVYQFTFKGLLSLASFPGDEHFLGLKNTLRFVYFYTQRNLISSKNIIRHFLSNSTFSLKFIKFCKNKRLLNL